VRIEAGDKLGGRVREGQWISYDTRSNGQRIYWPDTRSTTVERNVYFNEKDETAGNGLEGEEMSKIVKTHFQPTAAAVPPTLQPIVMPAPAIVPVPAVPPPAPIAPVAPQPAEHPRREQKPSQRVANLISGKGVTSASRRDPVVAAGIQLPPIPESSASIVEVMDDWATMALDCTQYDVDNSVNEAGMLAEVCAADAIEPRTLAEAKCLPDWPEWEAAIREELTTIDKAGTWVLVDQPPGVNVVGSKWVFRLKRNAAGEVVRRKARLVVQGFTQVPGIDYFNTFAPVAKLPTICTVLALSAQLDLELHQVDIKGAYLNSKLTKNERIYMRQPPSYAAPNSDGKVCCLIKTLYGLKQSGRRWYQRLVEILVKKMDFTVCEVDEAVFFHQNEQILVIVVVHVDNCTIGASCMKLIISFKDEIKKCVKITDLGELHWLLGMEIV
jgi:Reverse transcriptase (RNA-dependent DNA polymerase)